MFELVPIQTFVQSHSENGSVVKAFYTAKSDPAEKSTFGLQNIATRSFAEQNRNALAESLGLASEALVIPTQTHGTKVYIVSSNDKLPKELHATDALVTNCRNIALAVLSADCVPILLYDEKKQVIAAVHAGWRGMQALILEQTIAKMQQLGSKPVDIQAYIGPSISKKHFEVGPEVVKAFRESYGDAARIFIQTTAQKQYIDLWLAAKIQLLMSGLQETHIELAGLCTFTEEKQFYSARREGFDTGRMLVGICLKSN